MMTLALLQNRVKEVEKILATILRKLKGFTTRAETSKLLAIQNATTQDHESRIDVLEQQMENIILSSQ